MVWQATSDEHREEYPSRIVSIEIKVDKTKQYKPLGYDDVGSLVHRADFVELLFGLFVSSPDVYMQPVGI